jgi:spermidine synthase
LDSATLDGNVLDLYERQGVHMIRVNGWELMNGECHDSEDRLGKLAAGLSRGSQSAILLAGLGLGYTLASLTANLETTAAITVAEISDAVLRWFERHTGPRLFPALPDGVRLVNSDVRAFLGRDPVWDLIVLDVDNGPQPLSAPENGALYSLNGLKHCLASLKPSGKVLLWSSFEDLEFEKRARSVGFTVTILPISIADRPGPFHYIFILSREPLDQIENILVMNIMETNDFGPATQCS